MTTNDIANVQVIGSFFTMVVVVCVGTYIDRISSPFLKYVMLVPLMCGIAAILLLQYGTTFSHMCLYSMLLGAGMGINDLVTGVAYSNLFQERNIEEVIHSINIDTHICWCGTLVLWNDS